MTFEEINKQLEDVQSLLDAGIITEQEAEETRSALQAEADALTESLLEETSIKEVYTEPTVPIQPQTAPATQPVLPPVPVAPPAAPVLPAIPAVPDPAPAIPKPNNGKSQMWKLITAAEGVLIVIALVALGWYYGLFNLGGNDPAIDFITTMYTNKQYEDPSFITSHCSAEVVQVLLNSPKVNAGDTYATQLFRSSEKDPNKANPTQYQIVNVTPNGDGWYTYSYIDRGWNGACKVKIDNQNGTLIISKLINQ